MGSGEASSGCLPAPPAAPALCPPPPLLGSGPQEVTHHGRHQWPLLAQWVMELPAALMFSPPVLTSFCWPNTAPAPPFLLCHLLSPEGCSVSALMSTFQDMRSRGERTPPSLLSLPPRSPPQLFSTHFIGCNVTRLPPAVHELGNKNWSCLKNGDLLEWLLAVRPHHALKHLLFSCFLPKFILIPVHS